MPINNIIRRYQSVISVTSLLEILLFFILMYPNNHKIIKVPLIGILLFFCVLAILDKKISIEKNVRHWFTIYIIANIFYLIIGAMENIDVFYQLAPLKLMWPILYLLIVVALSSIKKVKLKFDTVMYLTGIIIPILIFVTYSFNNLPSFLNILFPYTRHVYAGFMDYFSASITSLFFLGGYSLTRVLTMESLKSKKFIVPFSLIILVSIIIGRRALLITNILTPIIFLAIQAYARKIDIKFSITRKLVLKFFGAVLLVIVLLYILPKLTGANLRILEIFNGNEVFQNNERWIQFKSLLTGWQERPFFGAGFGANAEIVRSDIYLGLYELSYVALLFQTGVTGFIIYMGLYTWLIYKLVSIYKITANTEILSFCVGTIVIFIANFSNPYIDSFDGLFFIFFGLAIINKYEINKENIYDSRNINGRL